MIAIVGIKIRFCSSTLYLFNRPLMSLIKHGLHIGETNSIILIFPLAILDVLHRSNMGW